MFICSQTTEWGIYAYGNSLEQLLPIHLPALPSLLVSITHTLQSSLVSLSWLNLELAYIWKYFIASLYSGVIAKERKKKSTELTIFAVGFPLPWPAFVSIRICKGLVWAGLWASLCCISAISLKECRGTTLSSWSAVSKSVAGYWKEQDE